MAEPTMTSEGDRSGVETPDPLEKARRCVLAARDRLDFVYQHFTLSTRAEIGMDLASAIDTLQRAQKLLGK